MNDHTVTARLEATMALGLFFDPSRPFFNEAYATKSNLQLDVISCE